MLIHVYVNKARRIVIYPGGGCHVEEKVKTIGWVIAVDDSWLVKDTEAMQKARQAMADCLGKLDMDVTV